MPVATSALPLDQAMTSAGMASIREVGLEIGNTIGRSTPALMASMISWVNAPCAVEVPSRIVGVTCRTASSSEIAPPPAGPAGDLLRVAGIGLLVVPQAGHVAVSSPCLSTSQTCPVACSLAGAVADHGVTELVGDADPGGPGPEHHELLLPHRDAGDLDARTASRPG